MTKDDSPHNQASDAGEEIEPEVRKRVDRLMRDLHEAPAIACPITFNWRGNQELANRVSLKIRI